jgi:heme-degrading monooxygenase HmoA
MPCTGVGSGLAPTLERVICRQWRGWAAKDNADAYERIVRGQVIPGIQERRIPGFRSIDLLRRERDDDVEFMTLMWFDTVDAVKAFMGEDYEAAHVPTEARAVLASFDERSAHFEVLDRRDQPAA